MIGYAIDGWRGYAVAAGLVVLAVAVRLGLGLIDTRVINFATFFPAIMLATLLSGYRAGIFAVLLSAAAAWIVFMPPTWSLAIGDHIGVINIIVFVLVSGLLIWLANSYRNALHDLKAEKDLRDLLLDEVRHRSRNSIAVARTIVENSLRSDPATASTINGRLATLLSAESLLMESTGAGERLQTVLQNELSAYDAGQIVATGSDVVLPARHARAWALIVHELATNAAKYGALSHPEGRILITWLRTTDQLDFLWFEPGEQAPTTPSPSRGFGSRLIDAMVRSMGGTHKRTFDSDGLRFAIIVPLEQSQPTAQPKTGGTVVAPAA